MQHARGFRWSREQRRLINSSRGGVSADLIPVSVRGAVARQPFPLLSRRTEGWKRTTRESDAASCLPRMRQDRFSLPPPSLSLFLFVWLACFLLSTPPPSTPPLFPLQIQLLLFPSPELRCSNFVLRRNSP